MLDETGGPAVDAIYLDFQKAFDTVPHERLLLKLEGYGITGTLHSWIADFLHSRRQQVVVNQLVTSYQWNTARQCPWAGSIHHIHE